MTVDNVSSTQPSIIDAYDPTLGALGGPGTASLTPDALLAYCGAQLQGLDSQVNGLLQDQQQSMNDKQAMETAEGVMKEFSPNGPPNAPNFQTCMAALAQAANSLPAGDPNKAAITSYMQTLEAQCSSSSSHPYTLYSIDSNGDAIPLPQPQGTFKAPGDGAWQQDINSMDNMVSDVGSDAEIGMIQIQSLVSQRQSIVQLTTGIMSTLAQSEQAVAAKIGS